MLQLSSWSCSLWNWRDICERLLDMWRRHILDQWLHLMHKLSIWAGVQQWLRLLQLVCCRDVRQRRVMHHMPCRAVRRWGLGNLLRLPHWSISHKYWGYLSQLLHFVSIRQVPRPDGSHVGGGVCQLSQRCGVGCGCVELHGLCSGYVPERQHLQHVWCGSVGGGVVQCLHSVCGWQVPVGHGWDIGDSVLELWGGGGVECGGVELHNVCGGDV